MLRLARGPRNHPILPKASSLYVVSLAVEGGHSGADRQEISTALRATTFE